MFDSKLFDELAKKLFSTLPSSLQNLEKDIESKFRDVLQAAFTRMDLVTREEFDVQCKVLARTREKLEAIELQMETLLDPRENEKNI